MSDDSTRPIVIKRKKVVAGGAHGGAWKIAYADFVTAMMAFFLLMWLLGSTAKGDLQGIADFFQNPLKLSQQGGSGSGDASSVLQGGGKDLTRQSGQVKRGDVEAKKSTSFSKEAQAEFRRKEQERLESLKASIEKMIEQSPQLAQFKKQMLLDITSEGLRIQIVDEQNRPMFDSSSADLKPYTRDILRQIGKALNGVSNRVSLAGHTDAAQFSGGEKGFSNWELSSNRANASRRELVVGGMDDSKVLRVVGLASTVLFDKNDPLNSVNRRISIVVLNQKTEMAILQEEGPESEVGNEESVPEGLKLPGVGKKGTAG
ncbi:flagellar motor protein MotB [Ferribacterium limneticum]|uniref:flagellar motor protein MotB n=1 Tax=Ferribacterium limneticum TaxID=76259 RepID=UPI001CF9D1FF|nr:flagellar motor protein MotB [Ferribacterium limneticum]UCV27697.1 flagellar motor protein MotB [Ferribacterium limneticum]UCV31614.1 flagellar motor protein MotB [Ferribacterium limneticum]